MKKVLLAIPAHNEEATIRKVITEGTHALRTIFPHNTQIDALVVNDNSSDNTALYAQETGATVLTFNTKQGLGTVFGHAVTYALLHAYDLMVTIDGDDQFDAHGIEQLCRPIIEKQAHMTTGSRFLQDSIVYNMPPIKRFGNHGIARVISWITEETWHDVSCGFRAYSREALLHVRPFGKFTYTHDVILHLSKRGLHLQEVPVTTRYFTERKSRIAHNLLRYGYQSLKIIIRSVIYYRPLRFFGFLTTLFWLIGFPIVTILGIRYLLTDMITPHKGIALVALGLIAVGFLSLIAGIILDILSRIQHAVEDVLYLEKRHDHE